MTERPIEAKSEIRRVANRVLVCGGRDYDDFYAVCHVLNTIVDDFDVPDVIIHGGSEGADYLADLWAHSHLVRCQVFPADWRTHGRAAGPVRNQQMIDEGKPTLVIAFPGGRGTADMVRRARAANIDVMEIEQ